MEMFILGKSEKIFQIKVFLYYNCLFFRIICSEFLRTFTKETFLFEIFFHFSPMKKFPFGLFLMGYISVFQSNDPKSMNFFYNFKIFRISCEYLQEHFESVEKAPQQMIKKNCVMYTITFAAILPEYLIIILFHIRSILGNYCLVHIQAVKQVLE